MIRIAVLSLSLLTVMSGAAVAPAVPDIIIHFSEASPLLGKMVLTTPALTIIPVALLRKLRLSGLCGKLKKKQDKAKIKAQAVVTLSNGESSKIIFAPCDKKRG
jgi:hypothetical protein